MWLKHLVKELLPIGSVFVLNVVLLSAYCIDVLGAQADRRTVRSTAFQTAFPTVSDAPFNTLAYSPAEYQGEPCQEGSPYYVARNIGKQAYTDRHALDFRELLSDVPPMLKDLYGECVEQLGVIDSFKSLLSPSIYVNLISLEGLKRLILDRVIEGVCSEIEEVAVEVYHEIADAIPLGEYAYHLDELFSIEVKLGP